MRGARCAPRWSCRQELTRLNGELQREWGVQIAIRTGVNSGEVVAGDASAGQALVTGDPVNVAARLQQAAAPGETLIGDATRRLVGEERRGGAVEPLTVRGKAEPLTAWRLVRHAASGAPRTRAPAAGSRRRAARAARGLRARRLRAQPATRGGARPGRHRQVPAGPRGRRGAVRPRHGPGRALPALRRGHHLLAAGRDRAPARGRADLRAALARLCAETRAPSLSRTACCRRPASRRRRAAREDLTGAVRDLFAALARSRPWSSCSRTCTGPSRRCSTWSSTC